MFLIFILPLRWMEKDFFDGSKEHILVKSYSCILLFLLRQGVTRSKVNLAQQKQELTVVQVVGWLTVLGLE